MNHFTIKHFAFAALIIGMAIVTIAVTNSCSSHTAKTSSAVFQDTIHLVSSPEMASLTSFGATDTVQLWQSCRCLFTLQQTGQGGDTKFFLVHRIDPDTGFFRFTKLRLLRRQAGR